MKLRLLLLAGLAVAVPAFGDTNTATITVTGLVGNACHMGTPASSTIALGALAALSDGTLAPITAPTTTINGSWCNTGSVISVVATPLIAQGASGAPGTGFTKAVNYTVAASGWTVTPASFVTTGNESGVGTTTTPVSQTASAPDAQTITVTLSNFLTPAAGERLVADPNYSGTITVTLAVSP